MMSSSSDAGTTMEPSSAVTAVDGETNVDWFQHNRFEGYVVKPEGSEPPERPAGDVKDHRVLAT